MSRFKNFFQLNSFIGLQPMEHSSGEKEIKGRMTIRNHKIISAELIECAWVAKRNDLTLFSILPAADF